MARPAGRQSLACIACRTKNKALADFPAHLGLPRHENGRIENLWAHTGFQNASACCAGAAACVRGIGVTRAQSSPSALAPPDKIQHCHVIDYSNVPGAA